MKVQVNITKQVLIRSRLCGYIDGSIVTNCAIAVAVRDLIPDAQVTDFGINIPDGTIISLPEEARVFIESFDKLNPAERLEMELLSFVIDVPVEELPISILEVHEILNKCLTLELIEDENPS